MLLTRDRPPAAGARGSRFIQLVRTLFVVNHKSTADATIVYTYIHNRRRRNAYPRQNANSSGNATGLPRRARVIIVRRGRIAKCAFRLYVISYYGHDAFMAYCNILYYTFEQSSSSEPTRGRAHGNYNIII